MPFRENRWLRSLGAHLRRRAGGAPTGAETQLEFPGVQWFRTREQYWRYLEPRREERRARDMEIGRRRQWPGLCTHCRARREFIVSAGVMLGENVNLREGLVCPGCGLGNRARLLFKAVEEFAGSPAKLRRLRVYVAERVTPFYQRLADRIEDIVGTEYLGADCRPGESRRLRLRAVRHEDLCRLSFPDEAFDIVINSDVLEHVADDRSAFAELRRVSRQGGGLFFSVPFLHERDEDEVRASVRADGEIVHHLPAVYHGNPVDPNGALAYRAYGWSLLDRLREAGFDSAEAGVLTDPELGFTSSNSPAEDFMEPVVFRALRAHEGTQLTARTTSERTSR